MHGIENLYRILCVWKKNYFLTCWSLDLLLIYVYQDDIQLLLSSSSYPLVCHSLKTYCSLVQSDAFVLSKNLSGKSRISFLTNAAKQFLEGNILSSSIRLLST